MNPDFQTIKTTHLTASQTAQIEALAALCREAEPLRITFPFEEADLFYLLWESDASTGAHGPEQARLPVSYTHLDVYKRQPHACGAR